VPIKEGTRSERSPAISALTHRSLEMTGTDSQIAGRQHVESKFCSLFFFVAVGDRSCRNIRGSTGQPCSITGTVTDTTGAVVAGAEVTATNVEINAPSKTVSNQDGILRHPNLAPGKYSSNLRKMDSKLYAALPSRWSRHRLLASIAALKVGSVGQISDRHADAPVLGKEDASIGTNMKGNWSPTSAEHLRRRAFYRDFAVAIILAIPPSSGPYGAVVHGGQLDLPGLHRGWYIRHLEHSWRFDRNRPEHGGRYKTAGADQR